VTAAADSIDLAVAVAAAASDKLADDIVAFDVSEQLAIADVFLLCSAPNDRQVRAVVEAVEEALAARGAKPVRVEGRQAGRWVLLDSIDLVVHVLHAEDRAFYALERLWRDCPVVPLGVGAEAHR
jgi:ribosome-associated protein